MQIKQGGTRSLPDGYLHLNNYSHSTKSGLAGSLYERVMTDRQRKLVVNCLLEIADKETKAQKYDVDIYMFKHDTYRFHKEFLNEHFKPVVYGCYKFIHKSPASEISMSVVKEQVQLDSVHNVGKAAYRKDPIENAY